MKKVRTVRSTGSAPSAAFDASHLVVILVVGLFFGFLGYQLGISNASPAMMVSTTESIKELKDNGATMRQMGAMMKQKGEKYRDSEMSINGEAMEARGVLMMDKGTEMMGKLGQ